MKCPYNIKSERNALIWQQIFAENDQPRMLLQTSNISYEQMDCLREECGAFHDGRCHYKD